MSYGHNATREAHAEYMRAWRAGRRHSKETRRLSREARIPPEAPLEQPAVGVPFDNTPAHGLKIAVIPDAQVKPGVPVNHLKAAGKYIAEKRPDVVVCIGDFADMPSLSTHEAPGHAATEGKRYSKDIDSVRRAMDLLMNPIGATRGYDPALILTLGNHEDRISRAVAASPKLEGVLALDDLAYEQYGWKVVPFLQPIVIGGVAFCHYFPSGVMGRATTRASLILKQRHMSAVAGHQQGRDIAYDRRADGKQMTAVISGSFYQHDEDYLSPFTNQHWRGMFFMHQVKNGEFDEMFLSLDYLVRTHS